MLKEKTDNVDPRCSGEILSSVGSKYQDIKNTETGKSEYMLKCKTWREGRC